MPMLVDETHPPWLLLVFKLPVRQASGRVDIWRKLRSNPALSFTMLAIVLIILIAASPVLKKQLAPA